MQNIQQLIDGIFTQLLDHLHKQVAVFPEARVAKAIHHVVNGRFRHQSQNVQQAVRNMSGTDRFLHKFRDAIFRTDPGPQALC